MTNKQILILLLTFYVHISYSQNVAKGYVTKINYTDINGQKQGHWKKIYPNGKTAYEGNFMNNKPVGEFLRYFESGNICARLIYDKNGEHSTAKLYYEDGKLAAQGNYFVKQKDSTWNYYARDGRLIMIENYRCGKKN